MLQQQTVNVIRGFDNHGQLITERILAYVLDSKQDLEFYINRLILERYRELKTKDIENYVRRIASARFVVKKGKTSFIEIPNPYSYGKFRRMNDKERIHSVSNFLNIVAHKLAMITCIA